MSNGNLKNQERSFKDLNLDRSKLDGFVEEFLADNNLKKESFTDNGARRRIIFGELGAPLATVELIYNNSGSTTVHYKLGKNQPLGQKLAEFLANTIDPMEFERVDMLIDGAILSEIKVVLESVAEKNIEIDERTLPSGSILWKLRSVVYQDELTVTFHKASHKLQVQGRPLSCYKAFVYYLVEYLNLKGLEQVLIRREDGSAGIIQSHIADSCLQGMIGTVAYNKLDRAVKDLLLSSLCIKLAAPELPDYSLLLFPELRAIEGALKKVLHRNGVPVGKDGFGAIFHKDEPSGLFAFKQQFVASFKTTRLVKSLEEAYTFYNKERHGLFHMEQVVNASRMISDPQVLSAKSDECIRHIKTLYELI